MAVSAEHSLSGPGLTRLARAIVALGLLASLVTASLPAATAARAASPYLLPYPAGMTVYVTLGNNHWDHVVGYQSQYAFDFGSPPPGDFPVLAARAGVVHAEQHTIAGGQCRNFACWTEANFALVDHGDGTSALYLHLAQDKVFVHVGEKVVQGQQLALADNTGYSSGPHLHFQVGATPCRRSDPAVATPCESRGGWWWPRSQPLAFADTDVINRTPNGVPAEGATYSSDNVEGVPPMARAVDWRNNAYQITCDGLVPSGFAVGLRNGSTVVPGAEAGSADYSQFTVTYVQSVTGDMTGDGRAESVVLLRCSPEPSNFAVYEVQVFGPADELLTELPSPSTLQGPGQVLPPEYDQRAAISVRGGDLYTPMLFYGPGDNHASGPSVAHVVRWYWDGRNFTATVQ